MPITRTFIQKYSLQAMGQQPQSARQAPALFIQSDSTPQTPFDWLTDAHGQSAAVSAPVQQVLACMRIFPAAGSTADLLPSLAKAGHE